MEKPSPDNPPLTESLIPTSLSEPTCDDEQEYQTLIDEFLQKEGKGISKCMMAIKINVEHPVEILDYVFALCRDFAGAFILLQIRIAYKRNDQLSLGKLENAFPIWGPIIVHKSRDIGKFVLKIHDVSISFNVHDPETVRRFQRKYYFLVNRFFSFVSRDVDMFTYRILSVKYLNEFFTLKKREAIGAQTMRMIKFNGETGSPKWLAMASRYRTQLIDIDQRDAAMQRMIKYFYSEDMGWQKLPNFIETYRVILYYPNTTKRRRFVYQIHQILMIICGRYKGISKDFKVAEMLKENEAYYQVLETFRGRGFAKNIQFDQKFGFQNTPDPNIGVQRLGFIPLKTGCYFGTIFYSYSQGRMKIITGQSMNKIPMLQVSKSFRSKQLFRDLSWMLQLGEDLKERCSEIVGIEDRNNWKNVQGLKKHFVKTVNNLAKIFGVDDLGCLYPEIISLSEDIVLFVSIRKVDANNFKYPHTQYKWTDMRKFELKFYQLYFAMRKFDVVETLDIIHNNISKRFISRAIEDNERKREKGVFIGLVKIVGRSDGSFVVVKRDDLSIFPHEFIAENPPNEQEWKSIQQIRFNQGFETFLSSEEQQSLKEDEFLCPRTFKQNFLVALSRLQKRIEGVDIKCLYDLELVRMDENDKIYFIILACREKENTTSYDHMNYRLLPEDIFLHNNWKSFAPKCYRIYQLKRIALFLNNHCDLRNSTEYSLDEMMRIPETKRAGMPFLQLVELEKKWSCMNWYGRIRSWIDRGSKSVTGKPDKFAEFELKLKDGLMKTQRQHVQIRRLLLEFLNREEFDSWESYEKEYKLFTTDTRTRTVVGPKKIEVDAEKISKSQLFNDVVHVSLEEVKDLEILKEQPTNSEYCRSIFSEIVEKALILTVDNDEFRICQDVMNEMIDVVETTQELVDLTIFNHLKEETYRLLLRDRQNAKKSFLRNFQTLGELDFDSTLFSYESNIAKQAQGFKKFVDKIGVMIKVIDNTQNMLEIVENMEETDRLYERKTAIIDSFDNQFYLHSKETEKLENEIEMEKRMEFERTQKIESEHNKFMFLENMYHDLRKKSHVFLPDGFEKIGKDSLDGTRKTTKKKRNKPIVFIERDNPNFKSVLSMRRSKGKKKRRLPSGVKPGAFSKNIIV